MGDRHQFRLEDHDYNGGIYFVTICSNEKKHTFGRISNNIFQPSELGEIIIEHLDRLPSYYEDVEVWNSVVMPNHIHLVVSIDNTATTVGTRLIASANNGSIASANNESIASANNGSIASVNNGSIASANNGSIASVNNGSIASDEKLKQNIGCLKPPKHGEESCDYHHNSRLASIIGAFKAGVTRMARTRLIASLPIWQSRYHEHVIRNQFSFDNIMDYINHNVETWDADCFAK